MLREENCRSKVVIDGVASSEYTVGHGLREGAVLSPVLYSVFIDGIAERLEALGVGVDVRGQLIRCLLYADDIVLVADSARDLQRMLDVCQNFADASSFQFSMAKSNVLIFGHDWKKPAEPFLLNGAPMKIVDNYTYLGLELHRALGYRHENKESGVADQYRERRFRDDDGPDGPVMGRRSGLLIIPSVMPMLDGSRGRLGLTPKRPILGFII